MSKLNFILFPKGTKFEPSVQDCSLLKMSYSKGRKIPRSRYRSVTKKLEPHGSKRL